MLLFVEESLFLRGKDISGRSLMGHLSISPQQLIVLSLELLRVLNLSDTKIVDGVNPRQQRSRVNLVQVVFNLRQCIGVEDIFRGSVSIPGEDVDISPPCL